MKKRYVSLILAVFMMFSVFAGCADNGGNGESSKSDSGSTVSDASQNSVPETESADWLPAGEKPTLRQLGINQADDYNTYPVAADIEKITGYHVEYDMLPAEGATDKLNLILASSEDYDMIVFGGDTARVMEYATQGALADINPYLQYAPNLNAAINDYERETFTLDGGLYAVGMEQLSFDGKGDVRQSLWLRQDWMDALGVKTPTTTDELKDVLRAFKTYDNGTGNAAIPMTLPASSVTIDGLIGAFGMPNAWNEVDGKLVYRSADPRMKDYLTYMKELYQEGLLDAEYPANQPANSTEKYASGVAGSCQFGFYDAPSVFTTMEETQPDQKTLYLPPVKGPTGEQSIGTNSGGFDRIAFIPSYTENLAHVINFMNIKLEQENFVFLAVGKEGVHYTVDEDGEKWPILPAFFDERGQANNYSTGRFADQYSELWQVRNRKDPRQYAVWAELNSETFLQYQVNSEVNKAPAFPETAKNKQSLDQMLLDAQIKIIAGDETVESYDKFLEQWMASGGQAMTDEYNEWYAGNK